MIPPGTSFTQKNVFRGFLPYPNGLLDVATREETEARASSVVRTEEGHPRNQGAREPPAPWASAIRLGYGTSTPSRNSPGTGSKPDWGLQVNAGVFLSIFLFKVSNL